MTTTKMGRTQKNRNDGKVHRRSKNTKKNNHQKERKQEKSLLDRIVNSDDDDLMDEYEDYTQWKKR